MSKYQNSAKYILVWRFHGSFTSHAWPMKTNSGAKTKGWKIWLQIKSFGKNVRYVLYVRTCRKCFIMSSFPALNLDPTLKFVESRKFANRRHGILRDSTTGRLIRLATGNKSFLYEEKKSGCKVPNYEQWTKKPEKEEQSVTQGTTDLLLFEDGSSCGYSSRNGNGHAKYRNWPDADGTHPISCGH